MTTAGSAGLATAGDQALDHIERVRWRHSEEGLRNTYLDHRGRPKDGMQIPRLIVFDRDGHLLGAQSGFSTGDMRGMRRLVHEGKPYLFAADLDDTRAEALTIDGTPAGDVELPAADFHIVIYRSDDCERCDRLEQELERVVASMKRRRFLWITIDSDPADAKPAQ